MGCLAEEIETPGEGQIRALITIAGNPVLSAPNGPRLAAALDRLELMVSVDIYLNETTRHADVILPGPVAARGGALRRRVPAARRGATPRATARRCSPPPPDRPAEWQILLRLLAIATGKGAARRRRRARRRARRRGRARASPARPPSSCSRALAGTTGPERLLDLALRAGPYGDRFGAHARRPHAREARRRARRASISARSRRGSRSSCARRPARSSSRRRCSSTISARARADLARPVPDLVIIGRRQLRSNNSWMHNLPTLAKGPFRCTALVHPADAARLGLADGGRARIASGAALDRRRGRAQRRHDARRRQPAARLGPRPARHAAARSPPSARAPTSTRSSTRRCAIRCRATPCSAASRSRCTRYDADLTYRPTIL